MEFSLPGQPQIGAVIRHKERATCMSFHESGEQLFVAYGDSRLRVVDTLKGTSDQPAYKFEREGVNIVEATHHNQSILISGRGTPDQTAEQRCAVSYLSLYDNKILRKFRGHVGELSSLSMSPSDDFFLSSSTDRTVRLWNMQKAGCLSKMELPSTVHGTPHAVFDSTGMVFGVTAAMTSGNDGHYVHLYDVRNYSGGAFAEIKCPQDSIEKAIQTYAGASPERAREMSKGEWTSMAFNMKGNQLLVTAEKGLSLLIDGFEGTILNAFCAEGNPSHSATACFTPDGETVLTTNEDGTIDCWSAKTGTLVKKLEGHKDRIGCIKANPKYAQFASSDKDTALWIW
mmetsp:Transcript_20764/g.31950  ORF Transcript_20764/g.31950 Transcript_20764/m.31950 type:complete len:343 (-) Transcript_20764:38-1066(-)